MSDFRAYLQQQQTRPAQPQLAGPGAFMLALTLRAMQRQQQAQQPQQPAPPPVNPEYARGYQIGIQLAQRKR